MLDIRLPVRVQVFGYVLTPMKNILQCGGFETPSYRDIKKIIGWDKMKDEHGRPLQSYSIRHMHITESLKRGERKIDIAKRCGTSVEQIENTYYEYMHEARDPIL